MIDKAFMLATASIGLLMFLWPTAFIKPPYAKDRATSAANRRAIGFFCFVIGLMGLMGS